MGLARRYGARDGSALALRDGMDRPGQLGDLINLILPPMKMSAELPSVLPERKYARVQELTANSVDASAGNLCDQQTGPALAQWRAPTWRAVCKSTPDSRNRRDKRRHRAIEIHRTYIHHGMT